MACNEVADELDRLETEHSLTSSVPVVGISYTLFKEYSPLWKEKNNTKAWIQAKEQ